MAVWIIRVLAVVGLLLLSLGAIAVFEEGNPVTRAVFSMGLGLVFIWIVIGGLLNLRFRGAIRRAVLAIPWGWQLKFVLFCTLLALLEEVVTVTMTNLAPLFGVPVGAAYITASTDYFDVVLFHSVIVFVPMFIAWAWLLRRYAFTPPAVFLLYGLTGTLGEALTFGAQNLVNVGFWTFVYGLMVYMPAYSLPEDRGARPPRWFHFALALVLPYLAAIPVAILLNSIHPINIHFPPIQP
jgi:hypothetical protein